MKPAVGVRAILFDVYGTLLGISQPTRPYRQLLGLAHAQGVGLSDDPANKMMSQRMTLSQAAQWLGVSLSVAQAQALECELTGELDRVQFFPEVPTVLTSLRDRGYRLGVCSNLATPYVAPAWRLLAPFIDVAIWSCEVGRVKPDPEIYRLAVRQLGVPASEVLMIGDTYRTDVAGPQAVGMKAQLLDRRKISFVAADSWPTLEAVLQAPATTP